MLRLVVCGLLGCLVSSVVAVHVENDKIVYDDDDRLDFYEMSSGDQELTTQSIVALVKAAALTCSTNCAPAGSVPTLQSEYTLCNTESFLTQKVMAFCSGTLIGTDRVLTAGHCITDQQSCSNTKFVFNFKQTAADTLGVISLANDVYSCHRFFSELYVDGGVSHDWAIVQLDREVHASHVPVTVASSSFVISGLTVLKMLGYPSGIPVKKASVVATATAEWGFFGIQDAFAGNSGSGIFNANNVLVGVLVRGNADYISTNGVCRIVNTVSSSSFSATGVEQNSLASLATAANPACTVDNDCPGNQECLVDHLDGFCNGPITVCKTAVLPCAGVRTDCCFKGDATHGKCKSCGISLSSCQSSSDSCFTCEDGFEVDVANSDCTGFCVPVGTAAIPQSESICPFFYPPPDCALCAGAGLVGTLAVAMGVLTALFALTH